MQLGSTVVKVLACSTEGPEFDSQSLRFYVQNFSCLSFAYNKKPRGGLAQLNRQSGTTLGSRAFISGGHFHSSGNEMEVIV